MDPVIPSRLGSLVLQGVGVVGVSVLTYAAMGSLVLRGNVITDNALNNAPSQISGSGSYGTYRACRTGSGRTVTALDGCTVTTSGSKATSNTCVIHNPFDGTDLPFTSSASIVRFQYDVIANPAASRVDIGPATSSTASGSAIADNVLIGTGSSFVWTGSGSRSSENPAGGIRSAALTIVPSGFLKVTATTNPTAQYQAICKAWLAQDDSR